MIVIGLIFLFLIIGVVIEHRRLDKEDELNYCIRFPWRRDDEPTI